MPHLALFPIIICCIFGTVRSDFFAQSFRGAGASSSGSAISSSSSGSISNSAISTQNSAGSSSSNSAAPSGNVAISSSRSSSSGNAAAISSGNSAASSGNSIVFSGNSASAGAAAAAGSEDQGLGPVPEPNPGPITSISTVDQVARAISDGLINSPVFGEYAQFNLYRPSDIFFAAGIKLLAAAGFNDPDLVRETVVQAVYDIGWLYSQLYFDTVGLFLANFVNNKGILTSENADYLALRFVAAIDLEGCTRGVSDFATLNEAVIYGFLDVLGSYGFTTYDDVSELFHTFSDTLRVLAKQYQPN